MPHRAFSSDGLAALLLLLALSVPASGWTQSTLAANTGSKVIAGDIQVTVSPIPIDQTVPVTGRNQIVTLTFRNVPVRDALRALSEKAGFNVVVDNSVKGRLNLDLKDVTIQDALEAIRTIGRLSYSTSRNTLFAADAASSKGLAYRKKSLAVIPLKYTNPMMMAQLLNTTLFAAPAGDTASDGGGAGGGDGGKSPFPTAVASADSRSNSLVIVGTPGDINLARQHVATLDVPRQRRTWRLNNSDALNVATMLTSGLFNDGIQLLSVGNGASSGGSSGGGNSVGTQPSSTRVVAENLKEGQGASQTSQGSSGGGGGGSLGGGSTTSGSMPSNITIRDRVKENTTVQITPKGVIVLPDTRSNSITIFGTAEQLTLADRLIRTLDRKMPQVVIEAALVEITHNGQRELNGNFGINLHKFSFGFNNTQSTSYPSVNTPFSRASGLPTDPNNPLQSLGRFNTAPVVNTFQLSYQLNALIRNKKAKLLSHPSIMTIHDSESVISIVDEVIRSITVTLNTGGSGNGSAVSTQANIGEVGIVLGILPRVGPNNTVSLRVRPTVSDVRDITKDLYGNVITLVSRRELLAQNVTLEDGQSFVLGGLVSQSNKKITGKIPVLGDLPIVGALARSSSTTDDRSEVVVIITPHIVADDNEDEVTRLPVGPGGNGISSLLPSVPNDPAKVVPTTASKTTGSFTTMGPSTLGKEAGVSNLLPLAGQVPTHIDRPTLTPALPSGGPVSISPTDIQRVLDNVEPKQPNPTWLPTPSLKP